MKNAQPGAARSMDAVGLRSHHVGFDGALRVAVPFLKPRSPAMNASSMCGINFSASTASPYAGKRDGVMPSDSATRNCP
jgi:hypothetical protein